MAVPRTLISTIVAASLVCASSLSAEPAKQVINPDEMPNPTSFGYAQANIVPAESKIVYVAGQVGVSNTGPNDFESQVDRAFANLLTVLDATGSDAHHVVKITLLIRDHDAEKLRYVAEKRRTIFGSVPPASTLIPVTQLYGDGASFEIDAIAVVDKSIN